MRLSFSLFDLPRRGSSLITAASRLHTRPSGDFLNATSFAGSGGAVAAVFNSSAALSASRASLCSAQAGGAAAALYASRVSASQGSSALSCHAEIGGGFVSWNGSSLFLDGALVSNCSATGLGAGVSVKWHSSAALSGGTELSDGVSGYDGSCVQAWRGASLRMTDSRCLRGTVFQDGAAGGGISGWYADVVLERSVIANCTAPAGGGGAYLWHSGAAFRDSTFEGNFAVKGSSGGGFYLQGGLGGGSCTPGVIGCASAVLTLDGVTFRGNTAGGDGGAGCATSATVVASGSEFEGNVAGGHGGGLSFASGALPIGLSGSSFTGNFAGRSGGAVAVLAAAAVDVADSDLSGNVAAGGDGGAVRISYPSAQENVCVMGQTRSLSGSRGAIAVAAAIMPTSNSFTCTWTISNDGSLPNCTLELELNSVELSSFISIATPFEVVTVTDRASGRPAFRCSDVGCGGVHPGAPLRFQTPSPQGFELSYQWVSAGDAIDLSYGLRAFWRTICPVRRNGVAANVTGDELSVSLDGVNMTSNRASGFGGGASFSVDLNFPRSALAARRVRAVNNTAALGGGGLYSHAVRSSFVCEAPAAPCAPSTRRP